MRPVPPSPKLRLAGRDRPVRQARAGDPGRKFSSAPARSRFSYLAAEVWPLVVEKLPFFALSAVVSVLTVFAQKHVGALMPITSRPWPDRICNALVAYCRYLGKCAFPTKLAVFYPVPLDQTVGRAVLAGMLLAGVTVAVCALYRRRPYLLMGWLWFLGTLVPVIGFVQVGEQSMADRYSYMPILQLAEEPVGFRLAISLHGATNAVRDQIMPINKRWPLEELLPAVRTFSEKHGRMVTLEFILIEGVNDMPDQAAKLRDIAGDLHAHVNLIPYNTVEGLPWKRPSLTRQQKFLAVLQERGVSVTLRREKGHDIDAACGQLRLKTENDRAGGAGRADGAPNPEALNCQTCCDQVEFSDRGFFCRTMVPLRGSTRPHRGRHSEALYTAGPLSTETPASPCAQRSEAAPRWEESCDVAAPIGGIETHAEPAPRERRGAVGSGTSPD